MKFDINKIIKILIQIFFFIMMPSLYSMAFSGVRYLFTQVGVYSSIEMTQFLTILIVLCLYTIIFGRFFCGYACAFGSLGDWIFGLHLLINKKAKKRKPKGIPERILSKLMLIKFALLIAVVITCYQGLYDNFHGMDPWDVFGQIRALTFQFKGYTIGLILMAVIVVMMFVHKRFFCSVLCPMGAVFTLLPVLPFFTLKRSRKDCIKGCSACKRICPAYIDLPDEGSLQHKGDCFQCQQCINICPKQNVHCIKGRLKGDELIFTLIKAAILAAVVFALHLV